MVVSGEGERVSVLVDERLVSPQPVVPREHDVSGAASLPVDQMLPPVGAELAGEFLQPLRVGRVLDQAPIHGWNRPRGQVVDEPSSGLQADEILVDAPATPGCTEPMCEQRTVQSGPEASFRRQDNALGTPETTRSVRPLVTMQSANPLQQYVHRTQIGDEKVRIDVEGLLERLGPNHDDAAWRSILLPERVLDRIVQPVAVLRSEAAVVKRRPALDRQRKVALPLGAEFGEGRLRALDRVADHEDLRAAFGSVASRVSDRGRVAEDRSRLHGDRLGATQFLHWDDVRGPGPSRKRQGGVGRTPRASFGVGAEHPEAFETSLALATAPSVADMRTACPPKAKWDRSTPSSSSVM